jgi:hypothetical protein
VQDELVYVDTLPNKSKFIIDLDPAPWVAPVAELEHMLKSAFIVLGYSWADRQRVRDLIERLKASGVGERDYREEPDAAPRSRGADFEEPLTIDHGIRGLDDRPRKDGRTWTEAAIASSDCAETIIVAFSRSFQNTLIEPNRAK